MTTHCQLARIGAVAAVVGAPALLIATALHPMGADPTDATAAFAEYAGDTLWVGTHLGQFLAVAILGVALLALASVMEPGRAAAWGWIGALGAAACVAATAVLQAVDGVALKVMVDRWAAATGEAQARAFEAAFAVRQVEIGLASLVTLLFGLTAGAFGTSILAGRRFPHSLGYLAVISGTVNLTAGVAQAHMGFAPFAMTLSMTASTLLLIWIIGVGIVMWRLAPQLQEAAAHR